VGGIDRGELLEGNARYFQSVPIPGTFESFERWIRCHDLDSPSRRRNLARRGALSPRRRFRVTGWTLGGGRWSVDRFTIDARWKYAAGGLAFDYPGFVHTVLVHMRARLAASGR